MRVVTADQIRAMDRAAITEFGIPGAVLMENAGAAIADTVRDVCPNRGGRIAVYCGAGNNGGDGYAAARLLKLSGYKPTVYMLAEPDRLKGDALVHFTALRNMGGACIKPFDPHENGLAAQFDLIIDALLGTGLKSAPREPYSFAISAINRYAGRVPVISADLPSGLDSDTGEVPGEAVNATITVTFACPKLGLFLFPGASHVGSLKTVNIGFDWSALGCDGPFCQLTDAVDFNKLFIRRRAETNKGDYGHVGIIAGSRGMAGAPALAARAAHRAGAGLVTVLTSESNQQVLAAKLDEQMTVPLPEQDGAISDAAFDAIETQASRFTVLCIGPGLTTQPGTARLVLRLLNEIDKPVVLDADGLNALAMNAADYKANARSTKSPLVLTPHPGEAARLLETTIPKIQSNRIDAVRRLADRYRAVALLKGRYTLIADPSGTVYINTTGNPGMASGGMGDTLTGIIGALAAQYYVRIKRKDEQADSPVELQAAAAAGAYLHGMAGDKAAAEVGMVGMAATDLIDRLPSTIRALQEHGV